MKNCALCQAIGQTRERTNPFAVAETRASLIVLGWYQHFTGYTLVIAKQHIRNIHDLRDNRFGFMDDLLLVSEAVSESFDAPQTNLLILGNQVPHLHIHIFPRHKNDPNPTGNVWDVPIEVREAKSKVPDKQRLADMRTVLQARLTQIYHKHNREDLTVTLTQQTIWPPHLL